MKVIFLSCLLLLISTNASAEGILEQLDCLARNVYHESRSETFDAQLGVAFVVLNRRKEPEENLCSIILKKKQFSWTLKKNRKLWTIREIDAWELAQKVALMAWEEPDLDPTNGAKFFSSAKGIKGIHIGKITFYDAS